MEWGDLGFRGLINRSNLDAVRRVISRRELGLVDREDDGWPCNLNAVISGIERRDRQWGICVVVVVVIRN